MTKEEFKKEAKKNGYKNFKEFTNPFTFMDFCCDNKLNGENSMCEIKESGEGCSCKCRFEY